jgi:predicted phosphodiesterase
MICVGDVHGNLDMFRRNMKQLHAQYPDETIVQVGDMGIGFPKSQSAVLPNHCKFIRGNHDHPEQCRQHPNYMGDYGTKDIDGKKVFWLSGAFSIDRDMRIEGKSWWSDEELTIAELNKAMDLYLESKPEIMITHDGPYPATHYILNRFALQSQAWYKESSVEPTRTGQALSAMFEAYKPKLWIFGHWHVDYDKVINGTRFICLPELASMRVEDLI